ncbi:UDP-3-O-(3-hydroxymyristoyl)glucosamine N-acyltransferase [Nitratireductor sp. XY-223]|uniref:UDP-3-O-(3-hydroxymyristoyl)glucosamine N-acyltransferase n=1 Tax=Nitratireductor sp. XY-223 TaxID=2561926 RepID=UPI00145A9301|nr:UDP-3-O-(3-hydroxymyristoyl)glucosamine N-acyltransferase [Nitratireductor sp. XY-223]
MKAHEIAETLGGEVDGDPDLEIERAVQPDIADGNADLAVALMPEYLAGLASTKAAAALVPAGVTGIEIAARTVIRVPADRRTLPVLSALLRRRPNVAEGVHPSSTIGENVRLGERVRIGPLCVIGDNVVIGDDTTIVSQATLSDGARVGPGSLVCSGVRIGVDVQVGARAVIHPNAVLGADGFSFHPVDPGNVEAAKSTGDVSHDKDRDSTLLKNESLGSVIVGDDVEIGASSAIDAGTLKPTRVGRGTKIDDLVMIGHNVEIGEDCILCAQAGIAGSTIVGDRVTLGGQAGVGDNLTIGNDAIIGATASVGTPVPEGGIYYGTPAVPRKQAARDLHNIRRLDRVLKKLESK